MDGALILPVVALVAAGALAGLIAGMFGVGGGIVIVPALYYLLGALGVDDTVRMHTAVGTSLATIIVTSVRSVVAHRAHGAVDMDVLREWTPPICIGALLGAGLARFIPSAALTLVFALGALGVATNMAFRRDVSQQADNVRPMPVGAARAMLGGGLGLVSSWMGIGGGVLGVVLMTAAGRPIHQAVGTSAGFGAAIGVPGAFGFVLAGLGAAALPPGSVGYVNLPGFAIIALLTALVAPVGAKLAHILDRRLLSRLFALLLSVASIRMLWEVLGRLIG